MFSQVCVKKNSVGGAYPSMHRGTAPRPVHAGIHTPPAAPAADGTHPTGMHSCLSWM